MVSTFHPCDTEPQGKEQGLMQNIDETAPGSEMALVWTLLVAASALVWLIPILLK